MTAATNLLSLPVARGRGRAPLAVAVALLGLLVSASPYLWSDGWQEFGFAVDYLGFHVWVAVPFLVLAGLAAIGRISLPAVGAMTLVLVAGTLPALDGSQSLHAHTVERSVVVPGLLLALVVGAWGADSHLRAGTGLRLRRRAGHERGEAVSFIQFPLGPHLAFLVFGPILDIKLALLYGATFGRGFVLRLLLVTVPIVLAGAMIFQEVVV